MYIASVVVNRLVSPLSAFSTLTVYPVITPLRSSGNGRFQLSVIDRANIEVNLILTGGPDGAAHVVEYKV